MNSLKMKVQIRNDVLTVAYKQVFNMCGNGVTTCTMPVFPTLEASEPFHDIENYRVVIPSYERADIISKKNYVISAMA